MSEAPQRPPKARIQFAISTLVMVVLVFGAMLGFQMKTSCGIVESFVWILMLIMAVLCVADIVNWGVRRVSTGATAKPSKEVRTADQQENEKK
jgi:hypothetical protein